MVHGNFIAPIGHFMRQKLLTALKERQREPAPMAVAMLKSGIVQVISVQLGDPKSIQMSTIL